MQLRNSFTALSNGAGTIAGFIPCDPSVTLSATFGSVALFTEWTNVTALWSQVRCRQLSLHIYPASTDEVKGDVLPSLAISGNLQVAATPTTYQLTMDNTDSQLYPFLTDQSGKGRYHAFNHDLRRLIYSSVGTPASTTTYSGCPGAISIFAAGLPINTVFLSISVVGTYEMMSRS